MSKENLTKKNHHYICFIHYNTYYPVAFFPLSISFFQMIHKKEFEKDQVNLTEIKNMENVKQGELEKGSGRVPAHKIAMVFIVRFKCSLLIAILYLFSSHTYMLQ